jgi:hypothetical protein
VIVAAGMDRFVPRPAGRARPRALDVVSREPPVEPCSGRS